MMQPDTIDLPDLPTDDGDCKHFFCCMVESTATKKC